MYGPTNFKFFYNVIYQL